MKIALMTKTRLIQQHKVSGYAQNVKNVIGPAP